MISGRKETCSVAYRLNRQGRRNLGVRERECCVVLFCFDLCCFDVFTLSLLMGVSRNIASSFASVSAPARFLREYTVLVQTYEGVAYLRFAIVTASMAVGR